MFRSLRVLVVLAVATTGWGQSIYRYNPISRTRDIVGDLKFLPTGSGTLADRPATCSAGEVYVCNSTGCNDGENIHLCTATNTWSIQAGFTAGLSEEYFLHEEADGTIANYQQMKTVPAEDSESTLTAAVTAAGGELQFGVTGTPKSFITISGVPGVTVIPSGTWHFETYVAVSSSVGVTTLAAKVYKRAAGGTETLLFTATSEDINDTTVAQHTLHSVQPNFSILSTDRVVVKYFATTTSVAERTVTLYYEGTSNYTHIHTPFALPDLVRGALTLTTVGAIPKVSAAGTLGESAIAEDTDSVNSTKRVEVGTASPALGPNVQSSGGVWAGVGLYADPDAYATPLGNTISAGALSLVVSSGASPAQAHILSNWSCPAAECDRYLRTGGSSWITFNIADSGGEGGPGDISFWTAPSGTANTHMAVVQRMHIWEATGNVGVGVTTDDTVHKLQVAGNALFTQNNAQYNLIAPVGSPRFRLADSFDSATRKEFTILNDTANNRVDIEAIQQGVNFRLIRFQPSGGDVSFGGNATITGSTSSAPGGSIPAWKKYAVVKIANGAGGCTNAKGCWSVNGGTAVAAATATSQAITWLTSTANAVLEGSPRWKTTTACAGITAITLTDLGTTAGAGEFFTGGTYNLKTAVGATNLLWLTLLTPGATAASTAWTVTISGAAENIDDITDGCAFDIHAKWSVLP